MKRKRPLLEQEESEEPRTNKKRKSRNKRTENLDFETNISEQDEEFELSAENEISSNSKKKGKKTQSKKVDIPSTRTSLQPGPSSSIEKSTRKKKKSKGDINQNGDVGKSKEVSKKPKKPTKINKTKKKNGLQNREVSESPSDFQPLGQLLREEELKGFKNIKIEEIKSVIEGEENALPVKKKRTRKGILSLELEKSGSADLTYTTSETSLRDDIDLQEDETTRSRFYIDNKSHSSKNEEPISEPAPKRPKKKVRIDETESLKIKKELADSEVHFSVRELPAKIIKSKLNKNLTEEVKVSPLTIQSPKKTKRSSKSIKVELPSEDMEEEYVDGQIKTEEIKLEDDDDDGEMNNESSNSEDSDLEVYYINKNAEKEAKMRDKLLSLKKSPILMPKEDQLILVQRIQDVIPEGDTKSYKFRLQKLEWEKVTFKNYTLENCQKVWSQLLKKVRHYRLLVELIHDIKSVIELNDLQVLRPRASKSNPKKHPDMPKRPLTSYFLYYIRKRDKIVKERPDLDTLELNKFISEKYQNLPLDKKQKYEHLAAKNREEYKRQMEEFYGKHPEMRKVITRKPKQKKQKPPKRPDNPYRLFMQSELSREEIAEEDKAEFKEVCREKWRQMSDAKKLGWINLAEEQLQKYEEELKEYMALNPEYTPKGQPKPLLSREEMKLKDKLAGKPKKPPGTAYGLFISLTLQSNEIVNVPPRERWVYTSTKWKAMNDEEREQYKQLLAQVHDQYEKDFKIYLESLPEDKREAEILRNMPKRRKNAATEKPSTSGTKKASTSKSKQPTRKRVATPITKPKLQNPIPPPRSAFKYFIDKYHGENPKDVWKNLDQSERENYERELNGLKDKYIKEFETFLKGLSKEELAAFCANRNEQAEYSSSEETDSDSEHGDNDESSDDSSDSSESDNDSDEN